MQASTQYQQQAKRQQMILAQNRALQEIATRQQTPADPTIQQQPAGNTNNGQGIHQRQDIYRSIDQHGNVIMSPQSKIMEQKNILMTFQAICQMGTVAEAERLLSTTEQSIQVLNFGLESALSTSNIEVTRYLLSLEAPITQSTAEKILLNTQTPPAHQIALFDLLTQHGWTPNSPGSNGAPLLPKVVTNTPLLRWFLTHGANPNFGMERHNTGAADKLGYQSCAALESASAKGDIDAVRMLFEAGAEISYGYPLHYAAGALPAVEQGGPGPEFDAHRIPIMQLLIERGADVNQKGETELVAHHPIMYAVMAGAVQRVRWLLERGADPEARGSWGSAAENAFVMGSEDMKAVMEAGIRARRAGGSAAFAGESLAIRPKPSVG